MSAESAYVGIDVAIAKSKRLPVVVSVQRNGCLIPLPLRDHAKAYPPAGPGNEAILESGVAEQYAHDTLTYLDRIQQHFRLNIRAVAIDAPAGYCAEGASSRGCESALGEAGLSYFSTPTLTRFKEILDCATAHKKSGGDMCRVPHANKLWMLAGFALFDALKRRWKCLETYPYAISHSLGIAEKKTKGGHRTHLRAATAETKWSPADLDQELLAICFGSPHDRVDAYLASWVASLHPHERTAYGSEPNDSIWVPLVGEGVERKGSTMRFPRRPRHKHS